MLTFIVIVLIGLVILLGIALQVLLLFWDTVGSDYLFQFISHLHRGQAGSAADTEFKPKDPDVASKLRWSVVAARRMWLPWLLVIVTVLGSWTTALFSLMASVLAGRTPPSSDWVDSVYLVCLFILLKSYLAPLYASLTVSGFIYNLYWHHQFATFPGLAKAIQWAFGPGSSLAATVYSIAMPTYALAVSLAYAAVFVGMVLAFRRQVAA